MKIYKNKVSLERAIEKKKESIEHYHKKEELAPLRVSDRARLIKHSDDLEEMYRQLECMEEDI